MILSLILNLLKTLSHYTAPTHVSKTKENAHPVNFQFQDNHFGCVDPRVDLMSKFKLEHSKSLFVQSRSAWLCWLKSSDCFILDFRQATLRQ